MAPLVSVWTTNRGRARSLWVYALSQRRLYSAVGEASASHTETLHTRYPFNRRNRASTRSYALP